MWGEKGKDYDLNQFGQAKLINGNNILPIGVNMSNRYIAYPSITYELSFADEYMEIMNSCQNSKMLNIHLDLSDIRNQCNRLAAAYQTIQFSLYDYTLDDIRSILSDAGINEIVTSINQLLSK